MTKKSFKILFVCTGNSCRSPMAEGILKDLLEKRGIEEVIVESAGTMAPRDMPPTSYALLTMVEMGIDITSHRSRLLTKKMTGEADLILVMETAHKQYIEHLLPTSKGKVFLLKTYGSKSREGDAEIADPIGTDLDFYRMCSQELQGEIQRIFPRIVDMMEKQ